MMAENAPIAVVITDQRMPGMTGVELLRETYDRFPETVRIILTGFADSEATIKAINDGHIYGYVNKPWEPDELKAIVARATQLHALTLENRRLVDDLRNANLFLAAVMDRLRTGAIALDSGGIVRAVNQPAKAFIGIEGDVVGRPIDAIMAKEHLAELATRVRTLAMDSGGSFEEIDLPIGPGHRVRVSNQALENDQGETMGRVILFKEISHEPLTRDFEEIIGRLSETRADSEGATRVALETSQAALAELGARVSAAGIESANMSELAERVSRTRTAIENWLDVDDALAGEDYPDAQLLRDRMRVAAQRWPRRRSCRRASSPSRARSRPTTRAARTRANGCSA